MRGEVTGLGEFIFDEAELSVTILVTLGLGGEGLEKDFGTEREIERGEENFCVGRGKLEEGRVEGLLVKERASFPASVKERDWGEIGGSSGNIVMP